MRKFMLTVTDNDGETQSYKFMSSNAYVAAENAAKIAVAYGHDINNAVSVCIEELLLDTDMTDAVKLSQK